MKKRLTVIVLSSLLGYLCNGQNVPLVLPGSGGPSQSSSQSSSAPQQTGIPSAPVPDNTPSIDRIDPGTQSTRLITAVKSGEDVTDIITKENANPNVKDGKDGRAAVHYAALNDDEGTIELLKTKANADLNITDNTGKTALDLALEASKFKAAKALLKNNARAELATSGLDRVLATHNDEILILMLQNGANANTVINKSITTDNVEMMRIVFKNSSTQPSNENFSNAINSNSMKCAQEILKSNRINKSQAMDVVIAKQDKMWVDAVLSSGVDQSTATKALVFACQQRDKTLAENAINNSADPTAGMAEAIRTNSFPIVELLIKNHANVNDQMDEASAAGNDEIVQLLLQNNAKADLGVAPSAANDKLSTLELLLNNGGDANLAMPVAIDKNNITMVNLCLNASKPADVMRGDYVASACNRSNLDILNALMMAGAPADPGMPISIGKGDVKMVEALLKGNASVERPDYLIKACEINNSAIARMLLDKGADPNPGMIPAINNGNVEIVTMLIKKNASADRPDFMIKSCEQNSSALVKLLLSKSADPNPGMSVTVRNGNPEILQLLLEAGADARKPNLIVESVPHNKKMLTGLLIDHGAKPEYALDACVEQGKDQVLALLLEKKVDVSDTKYLRIAVMKDYSGITRQLVDGGCNPLNVETGSKNTLLHIAAQYATGSTTNVLTGLVYEGKKIDPNAVNTKGETALLIAVARNNRFVDVVTALLTAGAQVNGVVNAAGDSPLTVAAKSWDRKDNNNLEILEALVKAGADIEFTDKKGNKPKEYVGLGKAKSILKGKD